MRMKTFCEFCGFCVRYYFLTSREGAKGAKIFINVITRITLIFTLRRETVSSEHQNIRTSEHQNFRTSIFALRRESVSSVKSRWLFISSVSRESTRICLHTESTEHTELRFVSLSLHADEDILWILWILCAILFSYLTRRRKGREDFYQRDYTDYTDFYSPQGNCFIRTSEHQNFRTSELQNIYFCTPQGICFICEITLIEKNSTDYKD